MKSLSAFYFFVLDGIKASKKNASFYSESLSFRANATQGIELAGLIYTRVE